MIRLTRLGGEPFILNADLIQYVEARPDTFVTLTTGQRLVVAEPMDEVLRRALVYQQAKHLLPPPASRLSETQHQMEQADSAWRPGSNESLSRRAI
jgi:flagellar protein FlbD